MNYHKKFNDSTKFLKIYDNHERSKKEISLSKLYISIDDINNRKKYKEKQNKDILPIINQGQLKLLLSELEFLSIINIKNLCKKYKKITILYVGCSPFNHGVAMLNFYSKYPIQWVLVDPRPINPKCTKFPKVNFIQSLMDQKLCEEINSKYKNIILISDIRFSGDDTDIKTKDIIRDQNLHNNFIKILKPLYSFLKFRYPFPHVFESMNIPFPNKFYLQAFCKSDSTETRMLLKDVKEFKFSTLEDSKEYEEKCFFYTCNIKRHRIADCELTKVLDGWHCKCYDCLLMFHIFKNFKITHNLESSLISIADYFLKPLQ
jgi:hypothetical protein